MLERRLPRSLSLVRNSKKSDRSASTMRFLYRYITRSLALALMYQTCHSNPASTCGEYTLVELLRESVCSPFSRMLYEVGNFQQLIIAKSAMPIKSLAKLDKKN